MESGGDGRGGCGQVVRMKAPTLPGTRQSPGFLDRFKPPFPVGWTSDAAVRAYLQIPVIDQRPFYAPRMVFLAA